MNIRVGKEITEHTNVGVLRWDAADTAAENEAVEIMSRMIAQGSEIATHTTVVAGKQLLHTVIMVRYED